MTKWLCSCGTTLTTSGPIPHPDGLYIVPEELYEARADAGDCDLIRESVGAHRSPSCGRLSIWWKGWGRKPTVYVPESR